MTRKPGKHQRSKRRCQDLKVNRVQSFVLRWYAMHKLRNQNIWLVRAVSSKQLVCFVHGHGQKRNQKHTKKELSVEFHNHSPLLTMLQRSGAQNPSGSLRRGSCNLSWHLVATATYLFPSFIMLAFISLSKNSFFTKWYVCYNGNVTTGNTLTSWQTVCNYSKTQCF